jgi:GH43 family beta-xylosidase
MMFSFVSTYTHARVAMVTIFWMLLALTTTGKKIRTGADPTVMKIGDSYYSADSADGSIWVRQASTLEGLGSASARKVWSDSAGRGEIWAPEITTDGGRTYIYFSAGVSANHRMYVISADSPLATYSSEQKLALPDDKWAVDGTAFTFEGQRWFVWSGWVGDTDGEQSLFICRMNNPTQPTGSRYIISQPREAWELGDSPTINEGPEAIVDPNGQLHIVYSANGSWGNKYCLADLRLRKGGDPTYVWDWYKSNGCLFGSHQDRLMTGWDPTLYIDGPGHHTFALPSGDINQSPGVDIHIPFVFHGVQKGTEYSWANRAWFTGSYMWWSAITYSRSNVPGDTSNTGFSFKFYEDPL